MKAIAIVDIDDAFINDYKNFAIECELIATSKKDTWWRRGIKYVGEINLIPFDKHTLKKGGKDYVIYERNYLFANLDREYELNKTSKDLLERFEEIKNAIAKKEK